jgi:hypothetical protein
MSAFSNYLELKIAQWVTNAAAMGTAPTAIYIGLFSSDPGEAGTGGTEVTSTLRGSATRPAITLTAATDGSGITTLKNAANFVFVEEASGAATVSHFAIFDQPTGNTPGTTNMLFKGQVNGGVSKSVGAGDEVRFNANAFVITID